MLDLETFSILNKEALEQDRNSSNGVQPRNRQFEKYIHRGFLVLDKPAGPTSHDVVATVKKILNVDKAGHSGTLDPAVSGVLPIGISDGTKILSIFSGSKKRYICNLYLHDDVPSTEIDKVLTELTGQLYQFPPTKSNVAMRLRKRTIYNIDKLEQRGNEYLLDITCEAGTYIRTLCVDIGKILGVGGEMKELRRIEAAGFTEQETHNLHDLFDAYQDGIEDLSKDKIKRVIKPIEEVVDLPAVVIRDNAIQSIANGAVLAVPGIVAFQKFDKGDAVQILTCKGELVALATSLHNSSFLDTKTQGEVLQPNRVIFDRNEYTT